MTLTAEDEIFYAFRQIRILSREVALQQMSKSGNAVRESMRSALKSTSTQYMTRVGKKGDAYLRKTSTRVFGQRESHTVDGMTSNPESMESFITSFLMEKSETLVVGGANPRFTPLLRTDGEVVGTGTPVGAVAPASIAILHRMDTGEKNSNYPAHSMLSPDLEGRGFMNAGMLAASGRVRAYLAGGYFQVMRQAQAKHPPEKRIVKLA